jgi:hypothetical protein
MPFWKYHTGKVKAQLLTPTLQYIVVIAALVENDFTYLIAFYGLIATIMQ